MPRITDEMVAEVNDRIAQAPHGVAAMKIALGCTRTMMERLADLNHVQLSGSSEVRAATIIEAHGFNRVDDQEPDGGGPCSLGRFEPHSRRAWECRRCGRRPIDHRPVVQA